MCERENLAHLPVGILWAVCLLFEIECMNEQNPRAVFERAVSLLKGGERQEAESLCRDALERDPGDINFVSLLGSILASRGAHEEAVDLLTRAVGPRPGTPRHRKIWARCC